MDSRPHEVEAAIEGLRAALDGMTAALVSGELSALLAAQETMAAAQVPSATLRGWTDESRAELRVALRRARAALNSCRRTNAALLRIVDACLQVTEADYNSSGSLRPAAGLPGAESRVSSRI
jgi:hypothetical protein